MKKILIFLFVVSISSLSVFAQTETTQTATRARTAATPVEVDKDNTPDPVVGLRDEIDGAATPSDRNRLQLKLADLLASTGKKIEALAELQLIANSNSFDPVGFYNLGNSFARLGESEAAIAAYRTAIEQRKGRYSRAYNNLGVLLLRTGRWDEAQDALLSALKLENFRYAEASYNLGRVYAARSQSDLAAREWRRALVVDPEHDSAKQALASARNEERIVVRSQPAEVKAAAAARKPVAVAKAAPASASKSLTLDANSFAFLQRAREASERGKMLEAVENFRRVLKLQGGYFPPANLELSYALLNLKRYDEALPYLLEVSKRDGARYPISYFHLARLYELNGELKLAEVAFTQAAAAHHPPNAQFFLDLTRVREKLGDFKGALDAMEQYLKLMPDQNASWSNDRVAELKVKAAGQK